MDKNIQTAASPMHSFRTASAGPFFTTKTIIVLGIAAILGIAGGYFYAKKGNPVATVAQINSTSDVQKGMVVGANDTSTFKDSAEGKLVEGGISGEGQFHLVRPGGDSQNVYLTSSTIDLSKLVNHKVKVWGQTQKAQHAGWLMDVGKAEVLE